MKRVGFTGEIGQAKCECHMGKTMASVYMIDPNNGKRVFLAQKAFDTPEEAGAALDACITEIAEMTLKEMGLQPDMAKVSIAHGDDATKMERELQSEIRGLH